MDEKQKILNKALSSLRKSVDSTSLADSRFKVAKYIDTRDFGLNRIISGNPNNGLPGNGKVILIGGESSSGKSKIIADSIISCLKAGYDKVFLCDSEGGALYDYLDSELEQPELLERIEEIPILSVEDAIVKLAKVFTTIKAIKQECPDANFLVILDSLGSLESDKFITDAEEKGRAAVDMGISAKAKNSLMRKAMTQTMVTQTSLLVTNHVYADPSAMYPSKIKNQSGGSGSIYAAHVIIQTAKTFEKSDAKKEEFFEANILKAFIVKNRMAKPFYSTEIYLDFDGNSKPYYGLIDSAIKYGFIISKGAWYSVPTYKDGSNVRRSDLETNSEIWDTFWDDYVAKSIEDISYGKSKKTEIDEIIEKTSNESEEIQEEETSD